ASSSPASLSWRPARPGSPSVPSSLGWAETKRSALGNSRQGSSDQPQPRSPQLQDLPSQTDAQHFNRSLSLTDGKPPIRQKSISISRRICPHSLRGLHATLAIEEGATGDVVARALGHTNFSITAKHYASADSVINARLARASQALAPRESETATSES